MRLVLIAGDFLWYALGSEAVGDAQQAAGDERQAQQRVEDTGPPPPELMDERGGATRVEIPVEIEQGRDQGEQPQGDENHQDEIVGRFHQSSISTVLEPSGFSDMVTFTTSPGNNSSIFSGHSMRQSAPL